MEYEALYLCYKTNLGVLMPFFKFNGSMISKKEEGCTGGSSISMDSILANINTAKLEEKCKRDEEETTGGSMEEEKTIETIKIENVMDRILKKQLDNNV